jgi:superfamily II DNA or RNA helicase
LKNIRKINFFELENYIHILSNDTIDVSQEDLNIKEEVENKNKNKFDFPKEVNVILEDMVYIDKNNLSGGVKHAFKRLASFANPEFFKKQRLRMSVYNIPMVIDCSKDDDKYIKLPRGTYEYLKTMCDNNDVKINLLDRRNKGNQIDVKFNGTLRDNQEQALNELTDYDTGILEAPTGFGKTVIATALIAKKKVNTLVIVEKLTLLRQWQSSLKKFLNLDEVGIIGGGKNIITNIVDVASIKSLWNKGNINQLVKNYGLVIMDECHHTSAYTYENALNAVNAKCIYGLSATPTKENGHTPIIKMQCGEIRHKIDFKEFNKELGLPMKVIIRNNELKFVNLLIKDYTLNEINDLIAKDVIRTEKIIKDIEKSFFR